jgi:DNA invertase Pin-like site-specific DNA recombinase
MRHNTARRPTAALARTKEAGELPWLALVGVLTFTVVALATSLARRVAVSTASPTAPLGPTPPRQPPGSNRSGPAVLRAARDPDQGRATGVEAVGYVTVTDAADGAQHELRRQITAMDAVCERRGWRLVEVARDADDTSRPALERSGLTYALEHLVGSHASCLIVAELQRLGGSAAELGGVLRWLRDRGLRLVAMDVDLDTEAADGRIAAEALISVGEREDHPGDRRIRASTPDADVGGRPGRPAVRDLPELQEHIRAMRSAGMTLQAIADRLNEEGVPTMRGGREWRPSSVQVAAGYRRPRRLSTHAGVYDWSKQRRRKEDR